MTQVANRDRNVGDDQDHRRGGRSEQRRFPALWPSASARAPSITVNTTTAGMTVELTTWMTVRVAHNVMRPATVTRRHGERDLTSVGVCFVVRRSASIGGPNGRVFEVVDMPPRCMRPVVVH